MPVTWTKTPIVRTNPFDGLSVTEIDVSNVKVDGSAVQEYYTFAAGTTDETIKSIVEADLAGKGYTWAP